MELCHNLLCYSLIVNNSIELSKISDKFFRGEKINLCFRNVVVVTCNFKLDSFLKCFLHVKNYKNSLLFDKCLFCYYMNFYLIKLFFQMLSVARKKI